MAFTATTVLSKKFWDVYLYCATGAFAGPWGVKLGQLDADASMKTSPGDSQKLATGIEAQISENGEVAISIIGNPSTPAQFATNYNDLKAIINLPCNLMFLPAGSTPAATENVKMSGVYIFPSLEIQANQMNKVNITAKIESAPGAAITFNQANNN